MLQVHQKYENLIGETFKNDPLFLSALDKACASVINSKLSDGKTTCRSAELVSYMQQLLQGRSSNLVFINFLGGKVLRQLTEKVEIDRVRNRNQAFKEHYYI